MRLVDAGTAVWGMPQNDGERLQSREDPGYGSCRPSIDSADENDNRKAEIRGWECRPLAKYAYASERQSDLE